MPKGGFPAGVFDSFNFKGSYQQNNYANVGGTTPTLYPLAASAGSYVYTGVSATLKVTHNLAVSAGAYNYTGVAATLKVSYNLAAAAGSYIYTGQTAKLKIATNLAASAGAYAYTGQSAKLKVVTNLAASVGSYVYTGFAAKLKVSTNLAAAASVYNYTGFTANLTNNFNITCATGIYDYTGFAANLTVVNNPLPVVSTQSFTSAATSGAGGFDAYRPKKKTKEEIDLERSRIPVTLAKSISQHEIVFVKAETPSVLNRLNQATQSRLNSQLILFRLAGIKEAHGLRRKLLRRLFPSRLLSLSLLI